MTVACPPFQDLNALVDGDLPADRDLTVRRHLDLCMDCRRTVDAVTALKQAVGRAYDDDVPSPVLRCAMTAALAKSRRRRWWSIGTIAVPFVLAAGAVLINGGGAQP